MAMINGIDAGLLVDVVRGGIEQIPVAVPPFDSLQVNDSIMSGVWPLE
jgi:hypothetical protein